MYLNDRKVLDTSKRTQKRLQQKLIQENDALKLALKKERRKNRKEKHKARCYHDAIDIGNSKEWCKKCGALRTKMLCGTWTHWKPPENRLIAKKEKLVKRFGTVKKGEKLT